MQLLHIIGPRINTGRVEDPVSNVVNGRRAKLLK